MSAIGRSVPRQLEKHEAWFVIYAAGYTISAYREFDEFGLPAALAIVARAVEYADLNKLYRLTKLLACLRIDLLLRANLTADARAVLEQSGIDLEEYQSASENLIAWRERDTAVHVISRLLIREGQHQQALGLLAHFSRRARTDGHVRARMKYKILGAIAHHNNGDAIEQDEHLEAALALFKKSRFARSFLDEKEALAPILNQYLAAGDRQGAERQNATCARTILKQFEAGSVHSEDQPLLSLRENEVLHELVHGFSNKVIARNIDVSESTVRFHLRNIFTKLNVASRLQAVTVARQKKLL